MRKTENLALIIVLMLLAACNAPLTISKADFGESTLSIPPGRLVYHLPKTVVNIEVTARKITEKRGPYYRYSERYLNLSDIITEDNEYWEIVEARIYTSGIPDPNRIYTIAAEGTPAGAALNLTPDGILQGFNIPGNVSCPSPETANTQTTSDQSKEISFDEIPFTEEQLIKTSSAATAEEVAAEIYNIRDSRRRLLEGDVKNLPPDEGSYQRILEGLNNMEKQYLSLFKGKRQTETRKQVFSFVPETNEAANQVLFRFSGQKGFTQIDDMTGTPVYIEVINEEVADSPGIQQNPKVRTGMIYCKPGKATVKVIDRTKQLTEKEILIGQFGSLHSMPPSLLDSPNTRVKMDPATGAILNVSVQE